MTEDPRGRGYPELAKPGTRATRAWRGVWHALLVENYKELRKVQRVRKAMRGGK